MKNEQYEKKLFSWIHLSDIHFLHGSTKNQMDQEMVLKALVNDIASISNTLGHGIPKPDVVFITGDIAYSGAEEKQNEYDIACNWVAEIGKAGELTHDDIFIVPGNHDVQRTLYMDDDDISMLLDHLREGRRELEWALSKKRQQERLLTRFDNYSSFANKFAPICLKINPKITEPYWHKTIKIGEGFSVRILGLNTSLLSQDDDDKGKLQLSIAQLKDFPDLQETENQLALALGHHPFSWLADGVNAERWLRKKVHVYLSGHIHDPESILYQHGGGTGLVHIQAGAIHGKSPISSSYNYSAVLRNKDQMILRIWNRIWSHKNKDFRDNPECHPDGKLYSEYTLSIKEKVIGKDTSVAFQENDTSLPIEVKGFTRKSEFITDSPPVTDIWVGRINELSAINRVTSGVIVITGIGGQGKSALASKFLGMWRKENWNSFWDWRDCREKREQFRTKLVAIIEHFTLGEISGNSLEAITIKELVRLFFEVVRDYKGLIVLDNMDHYVDIRKNIFTLGVSDFVNGALKYAHDLLIILTCRPKINYATPRFQEINLEGITAQNTIELFRLRKVDVDDGETSKMIEKVHSLTEGHPLWLNLIATQVATGLGTIDEIISDLEKGGVDDRAKTMLRAIWKGLNTRQELILRSMAELTKPVDTEWIHMCVKKEIKTWNQFRRAFESLQFLSLVMESQGSLLQKEFDLHPIVRNFIKTEFYTRQEREPFLDRVILVVKAVINKSGSYSFLTPLSMLENCVLKAELELRKDDFTNAIITLVDVGEKLILKGMPGDLFRVGEDIMDHYEAKSIDLIDLHEFQVLSSFLCEI